MHSTSYASAATAIPRGTTTNNRKHFLLIAALCACAGCGAGRPRIEGNVTLDGAPVDGGSISFFQGGGPGSDKGNAPIVGGKYVIEGGRASNLTPGTYTVRIGWLRRLAKPGPDPANVDTSPAVKQAVPPRYNTQSTLTREVTSGTNKLDFDLKSR
jgi:hypothetical protein